VLVATLSVLFSTGALAQSEGPPLSDIVVTGVRPEQIQSFVEQVSAVPPSVNQIARWNEDICLSVAGLPAEQGQSIVDRVSYRAEAIGLSAGREGCRPNAYVFFANDADGFTRQLVEQRRSLFGYYHEENVATLGQEALTSFVETSRPVRWWHVVQTVGADGHRLGSDQAQSAAGPPPSRMEPTQDGFSGAQSVRTQGTRLRSVERQDFNRVVIIVDGQRASGYPLDGIADYVAMVTLAQVDPGAMTLEYPTILNLFATDPDAVSFEMTNWDLAYLDGLYRSTRNSASVTQQVRDISRRMAGNRTPGG
jgi:hypothetical protein